MVFAFLPAGQLESRGTPYGNEPCSSSAHWSRGCCRAWMMSVPIITKLTYLGDLSLKMGLAEFYVLVAVPCLQKLLAPAQLVRVRVADDAAGNRS